jgi:aryl-alcohol dehydrogenase-like predicted oxidoreductase
MKYRTLGRTGLRCSEVGLGTWAFGSPVYGAVPESDALKAIHSVIDAGINFFDTAPLYGTPQRDGVAEEILGKGLAGKRHSVIISSKFGRNPTDGNKPNFHAQRCVNSVEDSLRRLTTDRIDVLFFHSPFSPDEIHDDVWEALVKLKDEGKVRFVGHSISMFQDTERMARDWARERKIDVVQVVYSLLNRQAKNLIGFLHGEGVGIVARESLANGFLSGAITRDTQFASSHLNSRYSQTEIVERVEQVERLSFLVRGGVKSMPQAAMRWVLDHQEITLVLSGARNSKEIIECAKASDTPGYTADEMRRAESLHKRDFLAA